jgi:hypothetical protein
MGARTRACMCVCVRVSVCVCVRVCTHTRVQECVRATGVETIPSIEQDARSSRPCCCRRCCRHPSHSTPPTAPPPPPPPPPPRLAACRLSPLTGPGLRRQRRRARALCRGRHRAGLQRCEALVQLRLFDHALWRLQTVARTAAAQSNCYYSAKERSRERVVGTGCRWHAKGRDDGPTGMQSPGVGPCAACGAVAAWPHEWQPWTGGRSPAAAPCLPQPGKVCLPLLPPQLLLGGRAPVAAPCALRR